MKRPPTLFLAILLLVASAGFAGVERTLEQRFETGGIDTVHLDVSVAEVMVRGVSGDRLLATVEVRCSAWSGDACRRRAEAIELESRVRGRDLILDLEGYPRSSKGLSVDILIHMPRHLALSADMGVGEVRVEGLDGDIDLDLGVGEVDIEARREEVGVVRLESGVGDVELRVDGNRLEGSGFISQDLRWEEGPGRAAIRADCGVGEITVRLR